MKIKQHEYLSALLDDEAGEFERRRLLDALCEDKELGMTLSRYALVGEVMRSRQRTVIAGSRFLAGIQAQLEEEPAYHDVVIPAAKQNIVQASGQNTTQQDSVLPEPKTGSRRGKQPWYGGTRLRYAMAASVAVVALASVLVVQNSSQPQHGTATLAVATDAADNANITNTSHTRHRAASTTTDPEQQASDTLKQYVTLHMQYRTSNGIAPSIQAISYAQ